MHTVVCMNFPALSSSVKHLESVIRTIRLSTNCLYVYVHIETFVLQTWLVAPDMYARAAGVIYGLVPNTTYVFLVRARNDHGLGGPSPLSDLIRTLRKCKHCVL